VSMMRDVPLDRLMHVAEFRASLRAFLRHNEQTCRRFGLTPQRYLLLLAIKGAPDHSERMSFSELAERLQLSRNTVTELCARAEEAGLLHREPSQEDQRVVYLRVSKEGERRLAEVVLESDSFREELVLAFDALTHAFHAGRRLPGRRSAQNGRR
jgi:DNA-binding MarR family transcriptional regulator